MDFTVKGNQIEFLVHGQSANMGQGKDQAFSVKGCESGKCSDLWKWFAKDVLGSHIEIKVNNQLLLVEKNDAIKTITRAKLAASTDPAMLKTTLSNERIKMMLENLDKFVDARKEANRPAYAMPERASSITGVEVSVAHAQTQPVVTMRLDKWKEKLKDVQKNTPDEKFFTKKNGFSINMEPEDKQEVLLGDISIHVEDLARLLAEGPGVHSSFDAAIAAANAARLVAEDAAEAARADRLPHDASAEEYAVVYAAQAKATAAVAAAYAAKAADMEKSLKPGARDVKAMHAADDLARFAAKAAAEGAAAVARKYANQAADQAGHVAVLQAEAGQRIAGNAQIEAAIKELNPRAIMEADHPELKNIQKRDASAAGGWRDGRYAFVLEKNDAGQDAWFLYVGSKGGNKILEVGVKGNEFTAEGGDKVVHTFESLEKMVKAFDGKIDRVLQSPQRKR